MKFVVAIDGSGPSDRALDRAIEYATLLGSDLTIVHAVAPDVYTAGGGTSVLDRSEAERSFVIEAVEDAEERGERILEEAAARARDAGVPAAVELLYGDPREVIPNYADEVGADEIFVGHRGLSEHHEAMVGSVAKEIVERATVPVSVVRDETAETTDPGDDTGGLGDGSDDPATT